MAIIHSCGIYEGRHWEAGVRSAEAELRLAERSPQRNGRRPRRFYKGAKPPRITPPLEEVVNGTGACHWGAASLRGTAHVLTATGRTESGPRRRSSAWRSGVRSGADSVLDVARVLLRCESRSTGAQLRSRLRLLGRSLRSRPLRSCAVPLRLTHVALGAPREEDVTMSAEGSAPFHSRARAELFLSLPREHLRRSEDSSLRRSSKFGKEGRLGSSWFAKFAKKGDSGRRLAAKVESRGDSGRPVVQRLSRGETRRGVAKVREEQRLLLSWTGPRSSKGRAGGLAACLAFWGSDTRGRSALVKPTELR